MKRILRAVVCLAISIMNSRAVAVAAQTGTSLQTSIKEASSVFASVSHGRVIAVLDFPTIDNQITQLSAFVSEQLAVDLAEALGTTGSVVERRQVLQVLEEERLSAAGLTSRDAARVAQKLGADLVLLGSITVLGSQVVINARAVTTDSAVMIKAHRIEGTASPELLQLALRPLPSHVGGETQPPADSVTTTKWIRDIEVVLNECVSSTDRLYCDLTMTSHGSDVRVDLGFHGPSMADEWYTVFFDERGQRHGITGVRLAGTSGTRNARARLLANLPTAGRISFTPHRSILRIPLLEIRLSASGNRYTLRYRDVAVRQGR